MPIAAISPAGSVESWLRSLPADNGVVQISSPRRYTVDESQFDALNKMIPSAVAAGAGLVALARESGADFSAAALEIGCGTGNASLGLVSANAYPLTLITDSSPAFVEIARRKLGGAHADRTRFGILMGEDISRLPPGAFSLVAMRSVLHHVIDVDAFIAQTASLLTPGGVFICQEPCWDGTVFNGLLAQCALQLSQADGRLNESDKKNLLKFVTACGFLSRRGVDKSKHEDKHAFRPDEMARLGSRAGLTLDFHPNVVFQTFNSPHHLRKPHPFPRTFLGRLAAGARLGPEAISVIEELLRPCLAFLEGAARGGTGPYGVGVFVFKK